MVAERIAEITGLPFTTAPNKFEALAAHDAMVFSHGAINTVAAACSRSPTTSACWARARARAWANWRCRRTSPAPRSCRARSIPTQCEAMTKVCVQIFGNNAALTFAGSQGHFELNVYNPVMAYNFLQIGAADGRRGGELHRQLRGRHRAARATISRRGWSAR